ncbi:transmembrane protein 70, mitochondrial-like protein [Euroglyphus maynei]|uniref:Transmembrane protein 70, mitochondrial-like protein n=1 Tax=Euroglyphus maynei TaxID=6958 RepID=A0A1Y3BCB6_EURMA|nr:transmembrane protein 70, mitochondrial-like protein [Euroglyphus maynei]
MAKSDSPGRLIYEAPEQMIRMIKMIKRLSISTTILSAGVQPFLYPKLIATGSSLTMGFATITCAGIFISPLILNWFTKRYVTKLYYDDHSDQFTAKHLNLLNRVVQLQYKSNQVQVPEMLGIFTTYTVGQKKRPLFVDPNMVIDMNAYKRMLGFDRPVSLKPEDFLRKQQNDNDDHKK